MTLTSEKEALQLNRQIHQVADQILAKLGKQSKGDVHVAIAGLAVAMCSLAHADGMSFEHMQEAIKIAFDECSQ